MSRLADRLALGGLVLLAAAARLPGIAARGTFDQDQGHDALVLLGMTQGSGLPLLGPPTSIGDFHHGAFYYDLLFPAALVSGANPVAITIWIALMGIAAVGVTWWLARAIAGPVAGPVAGFVAGLLLAVSPAAIDESTFIWNPNPIPLFAALALGAAWRGHQTSRGRWWTLAIACAGIVFQLHVLGVVFLPPVIALLVADVRAARRRGEGAVAGRLVRGGLLGIGIAALLFVPLLLHELRFDWSETRHALAYFTSGTPTPGQLELPARLVFTLVRIIAWPLVGLVTDAPAAAALAVAIVLTLGLLGAAVADGEPRFALRWLLLTIAWTTVALAVLAPSLQTVVAGLPNDHYHAYIDPIVVTIVGVAVGLLATRPAAAGVLRGSLAVAVVALVAIGIWRWPAWTDPNGGWPGAEAAGARIVAHTGGAPVAVVSVPGFKTPEVMTFPILYAGGSLAADGAAGGSPLVVVCDRLFEPVVGKPCGGPAEDQLVAQMAAQELVGAPVAVERFDATPRTVVSIYARTPAGSGPTTTTPMDGTMTAQ